MPCKVIFNSDDEVVGLAIADYADIVGASVIRSESGGHFFHGELTRLKVQLRRIISAEDWYSRAPASRVYDDLIDSGKASPDSSQRDALQRLDHLADRLTLRKVWSTRRKSLFRRQSWGCPEGSLSLGRGGSR